MSYYRIRVRRRRDVLLFRLLLAVLVAVGLAFWLIVWGMALLTQGLVALVRRRR